MNDYNALKRQFNAKNVFIAKKWQYCPKKMQSNSKKVWRFLLPLVAASTAERTPPAVATLP